MTGRLVGYIRVSTVTQTHDQQRDALVAVGVQERDIFAETISGAARQRPEFERMLAYVAPGDTIVVSSFDRFGRNVAQVFATIELLLDRGVHVQGLREQVSTASPAGKMVAGLFIVIAEYERALIAERTEAWRQGAKRRGVRTGRKPKLDAEALAMARALLAQDFRVEQVAKRVGCSRATLYRALNAAEVAA